MERPIRVPQPKKAPSAWDTAVNIVHPLDVVGVGIVIPSRRQYAVGAGGGTPLLEVIRRALVRVVSGSETRPNHCGVERIIRPE